MIKAIWALLLVGLLFFSGLFAIFYRAMDSQFLVARAREVNLYARLTNQVTLLTGNSSEQKQLLTKEELTEVIQTGIGADRFYDFLGQYLTAVLSYLKTGQDPDFHYDLAPVKQSLSDRSLEKVLAGYNQLPICRANELRSWQFIEQLPSCKLSDAPPGDDITRLARQVTDSQFESLPDQITLTDPQPDSALAKNKDIIIRLLWLAKIVWLTTGLFLLAFLAVWRRHGFFSLAVVFILVGLVQVAFGLIGWDWLAKLIGEAASGGAKDLAPLISDLATTIIQVLKTAAGNISIITLGIGATFIALTLFSRQGHRTEANQPAKR